jgi:DNA-binding GntR family transcriptional regulator
MDAPSTLDTRLLYRRVCQAIARDIEQRVLKPAERLPSERELCDRLSVSRATVRRAMRQLATDGLVESIPGRGTFVSAGPLGEAPNTLMSFTHLGTSRGLVPTARVLQAEVRPTTLDEAETFAIAPGAEMFCLERVRCLDGLPVSIDSSRVPLARARLAAEVDFETASLYATLESCGAAPVRADFAVSAVPATEREAELLEVEPQSPLLLTTTSSYDEAGRLVELGRQTYRADRYRFRATLTKRRW